jgi:hypothetical protein
MAASMYGVAAMMALVRTAPLLPHARVFRLPLTRGARPLHRTLQKRSVRCVTELTVRQAREMLTAWAAEQDAVAARRDEVVGAAIEAGLSKAEVHRLTGIARTTVDRILGDLRERQGGDA